MVESWVLPCNLKLFDLVSHLESSDSVIWKRLRSVKEGDVVYIYIGAPYSEIRYKGVVESIRVDKELLTKHPYAEQFIRLSCEDELFKIAVEFEFPSGKYTFKNLKSYGLGQVQTMARADRRLKRYLEQEEALLREKRDNGEEALR